MKVFHSIEEIEKEYLPKKYARDHAKPEKGTGFSAHFLQRMREELRKR